MKTKMFVNCFQPDLGFTPPFRAELVRTNGRLAVLRVGDREFKANRDACSTVPFPGDEMDALLAKREKKAYVRKTPAAQPKDTRNFSGFGRK